MVQLHNFFFFITSMVVPRGTAAPLLLKWFVSRDVSTGAPSSNGTIIPIPIPSFLLLVYLHSRKFIGSMEGAKSYVLVIASRPILLADIIGSGRRSSESRASKALFPFVPLLHFLLLESKADFSYFESFCGVLCLLFCRTFFSLPRDSNISGDSMFSPIGEGRKADRSRSPRLAPFLCYLIAPSFAHLLSFC